MSKINATYSSGYYIAPDVDFRKLEDQQRLEQRGKRRKPGTDSGDAGDDNVKRQTFAIPFDLFCLHCNHRIVRGSHVYTNRRATDQRYLDSIRIWELEIMCRFCKGRYYLRTDPETPKETGGYICVKGCKRVEGDFFALNQENKAEREAWEQAKATAELDPLAALEKENEAARQLEERNRQIEAEVEREAEHNDSDLLAMLRSRPRRQAAALHDEDDNDEDNATDLPGRSDGKKKKMDGDGAGSGVEGRKGDRQKADEGGFFPPPPTASALKQDREGSGDEGQENDDVNDSEEDADERSYREFEEDMARRWRALEREQRAQRRKELESATAKPAVAEAEVDRVLARYGGGRRAAPPTGDEMGEASGVASPSGGVQGSSSFQKDSTGASASLGVSAPVVHRNKFLVADDDDDDGEGGDDVELPWKAPPSSPVAPQRFAVPSATPPAPRSAAVLKSASPVLPAASRPASSDLLRNLADSDSDDDDGDDV